MMTAVLAIPWTDAGAVAILIACAVLGGVVVRYFPRRPAANGVATREFLVNYHQIQHETYGQRRPFARLRAWVQAESAGLPTPAAEFESAAQEFLTLGLAGLGQFVTGARSLSVSGPTVSRLRDALGRLEATLRASLTGRGPERLSRARDAVQCMDVLSAACLDAYREVSKRNPCRAVTELRAVLATTSAAPDVRRVEVVLQAQPEADCGVLFDPAALRTIAAELIRNAARALEAVEKPQIRVDIRCHPTDPRYILLVVNDNGPGIPEEIRGRLLRPGASSRPDGGFGLARAGEIARAWMGDLDVSNRQQGGAAAALKMRVLAFEMRDASSSTGGEPP